MLVTIVQLSFEAGDWPGLNERIIDLVKKRSQLKQAVAKMVTEACTFLDKTPDKVDIQYINEVWKVHSLTREVVAPRRKCKIKHGCCQATMMKLIDTLRTVTAGKIYVENERARLTHR